MAMAAPKRPQFSPTASMKLRQELLPEFSLATATSGLPAFPIYGNSRSRMHLAVRTPSPPEVARNSILASVLASASVAMICTGL
jgi:hypothetical protein